MGWRRPTIAFLVGAIAAACVGSDPDIEAPGPSDGADGGAPAADGGVDATLDGGGEPLDASGIDAADSAACTACGDSGCVLLDSDPKNCGACGHVCDSDSCSGGTCSEYYVFIAPMESQPASLGGLQGADDKCSAEARAFNLKGTYKAWISTTTVSAGSRLFHAPRPYRLKDGTLVANDWNDLVSGTLRAPINTGAGGAPTGNDPNGGMFTNTLPDGGAGSSDCDGWTVGTGSSSSHARGSNASMTGSWTQGTVIGCVYFGWLYCFEQ